MRMRGVSGTTERETDSEHTATSGPDVAEVLKRWWGFETLRPLQIEAIHAALAGRDSLVVMPTGGGKSLCYRLPPPVGDGLLRCLRILPCMGGRSCGRS